MKRPSHFFNQETSYLASHTEPAKREIDIPADLWFILHFLMVHAFT